MTFTFAIAFFTSAILLGALVYYYRKLARSRLALQELAERLHGRITRRSLFSGDLLEGLHGGTLFTCRYFIGSKNNPPNLTILVKTSCPAKLTIRREAWYDRFAKRISLVAELQTGDPLFDGAYFFDTDRDDIFQPYLSEAARRQQIDALYNMGFPVREVTFGRKDLRIVLSPLRGDVIASVPVDKYLDGLLNLCGEFSSAGYSTSSFRPLFPGASRSPVPPAGLVFLFCFIALLIMGGAVALGYGINQYEPIGNQLIINALVLSAPAALIFLGLVFQWIRGRSSSHRIFLIVLIFSLIGFPLAFAGGAVITNGYLDQGMETSRKVSVVDQYCKQNKKSQTYYVTFPSWQRPGQTDCLSVPVDFFRAVRRGDGLVIRTKPGYWQGEWIVGIERISSVSSRADVAEGITLRLQGVRFYEGGISSVPRKDRHFVSEFARETSRFIWSQVDVENNLWQDRDRTYTFGWQYINPDGSVRGELSLPFTISKEWQTAWVNHSWGWSTPGQWPPGDYRVIVLVDGRPLGEGTFTIR